jgi:hypothetical protein
MYDRSRLCVVVSYRISAETIIVNITCEQRLEDLYRHSETDSQERTSPVIAAKGEYSICRTLDELCVGAIDTEAVHNKIHPSRGGGQLE